MLMMLTPWHCIMRGLGGSHQVRFKKGPGRLLLIMLAHWAVNVEGPGQLMFMMLMSGLLNAEGPGHQP